MFVVEFHQGPDWMVGGAEFTSLQIRDLDVFYVIIFAYISAFLLIWTK